MTNETVSSPPGGKDRFKVLDRIKKLLGLSTSANPHEAASAAAMAQKLMHEHKLEAADLDEVDPDQLVMLSLGSKGFTSAWRFILATVVCRAFFCEAVGMVLKGGKKRKVKILGRREDTEVAATVYKHFAREIDRLTRLEMQTSEEALWLSAMASMNGRHRHRVRSYSDSFRRGAVQAIGEKLLAAEQEFAKSSEKALVLVQSNKDEIKEYIVSHYGDRHRQASLDDRENLDDVALYRGYAEGSKLPIPARPAKERQKISGEKP